MSFSQDKVVKHLGFELVHRRIFRDQVIESINFLSIANHLPRTRVLKFKSKEMLL
ncbi:hypothetical protein Scep_026092 [Stephania cephalantha]|uniref:Uncharacterized protein n=1 Tax=Stephania cephalantha TaxID=152367 RepID=A0AAP0EQ27_9MAGN